MVRSHGTHEDFDRENELKAGSKRSFGLVFAVVFTVIGFWPLVGGGAVRFWALAVAFLFALAAVVWPHVLKPLNQIWFRFGQLLHGIINPLVMALLFYATVTPMALVMRIVGRDPLRRRFNPDIDSYWISRKPVGPASGSMKNQF